MKLAQLKWLFTGMVLTTTFLALFAFSNNNKISPVLMTRENMEAAVQIKPASEIKKPGKIWVYDNFIFVIEQYRGIHILDNTNPENPINKSFIQIDGCTDVAVQNGIIYANNAVDLIGVKPSADCQSIEVVSRNKNILPELKSPEVWSDYDYERMRPDNSIIVRWESNNE